MNRPATGETALPCIRCWWRDPRALVLAFLAFATPALPCALPEPFAVTDLAAGPIVVAATVTDYKVVLGEGTLTLDITNVWKGTAPARLTARWQVRLAEPPPETWNRPATVIAALTPADAGFDLMVEMCGQAWLVPDTPKARAEIRGALSP
jgi:hypothetical protein